MDLMHYAEQMRYGELHICHDEKTGLKAIVALHNLKLGPAIGGCRCIEYPCTDDALRDVMRLARGMTYKAAISNLPHGGGKSVIMRPPSLPHGSPERQALFEAFGDFVDSLGGRYLPAEDSGTTLEDMNVLRTRTEYCLGSSAGSGDPSPFTAYGVRRGIEAAVKFQLGRDDMEGLTVAIQGLGHVGWYLAKELHELGANLIVTDMRVEQMNRAIEQFGATAVQPDAIYGVDADIFAPCALGAVINDETLPQLKVKIVAGAANNQLAEDRHGEALRERGVLYAPDYALNAGGLINVASEAEGYDREKSHALTTRIYDTMMNIFERSSAEGEATSEVADRIVEEIIYA
jgi:leucine dehydrogenase